MRQIKLSIIIPIYNVEKYLAKCIDSLICQMSDNVEILLIDDGSLDKSGTIADIYAKKYTYITSFHKKNGGLSDARNYGIERSNGDYLWFIDSDDYIENNSLSKLLEMLRMYHPDTLVIQSKEVRDRCVNNERNYTIEPRLYDSHQYMEQLKIHPEASIFCAQYEIVNKQLIIENKLFFYKGIIHEDELWTPQVLVVAKSIFYSGLNIYYHVMRNGSIMNSKNFEKSGRSDIIVTEELFKVFNSCRRNDLVYMRDHAIDIFLQATWKIPDFIKTEKINRFLPIKNAYYIKTRMKALIYVISPKLYLSIHNWIKPH